MEKIKDIVISNFTTLFSLLLLTGISLFLLMIRLKLTHSFFLLFLVWNLFLAAIPYGISFYLTHIKQLPKWKMIVVFFIWLLFLPNAPYILTDFIHLAHLKSNFKILDVVLILSFALTGLYFYVLSMKTMKNVLRSYLSKKHLNILFFCIPFLCGFGIYLGRFLRWNSWDIIQNPLGLLKDLFEIMIMPHNHALAWGTTLSFGIGLWFLYRFFKKFLSTSENLV